MDNLLYLIFYLFSFIVNPDFREREEKKTIEREKILKQNPSMVELENQKFHKLRQEKKNYEIENNLNILENCLDDPYFCVNNEKLLSKVKDFNLKNSNIPFAEKIQNEFNYTYYGCFCRKNIDTDIYKYCPIEQNGLDELCTQHHSCIRNLKLSWDEFSNCDKIFDNKLINLENQITHIKEKELSQEKSEMIKKSKHIRGLLFLRSIYH